MKTGILKYLFWLTLFAVAMAFLEGAVVVYLRELYYPEGFQFPLRAIEKNIVIVEILREAATMIMLLSVAILAGKKGIESFAWFIYSFCHLGYILLCIFVFSGRLATKPIGMGYLVFNSCNLGRASNCTSNKFYNDDRPGNDFTLLFKQK